MMAEEKEALAVSVVAGNAAQPSQAHKSLSPRVAYS